MTLFRRTRLFGLMLSSRFITGVGYALPLVSVLVLLAIGVGLGSEYTNIVCTAITPVGNGVVIRVGYESDFTNRLDIFSCDDIKDPSWRLGGSNLVTIGTNFITWVDTTATIITSRFYVVGNCADLDGDGIESGREYFLYGTSPYNADTDGDGMPDGWELGHGLSPLVGDSAADPDGDGLSNLQEYQNSTDPNNSDTDNDGMGDGAEVAHGNSPINADSYVPLPFTEDFEMAIETRLIEPGTNDQPWGPSAKMYDDRLFVSGTCIEENRGAVNIFRKDGTNWIHEARLTATNRESGDYYGNVAVYDNRCLVGAYWRKNDWKGAAYVYKREGTNWTLEATLTASDGASNDYFGCSVALLDDTALVGADGKDSCEGVAYVFKRDGTNWSEEAKLTPFGTPSSGKQSFGNSVALLTNRAVIGAYVYNPLQGAVYVFRREGTNWIGEAQLTSSDGGEAHFFGQQVAAFGDRFISGSTVADNWRGAAYIFKRDDTNWNEEAKITASDGEADDLFGGSVSLLNDKALIGAHKEDNYTGSAYIFRRNGTNWSEEAKLMASDGCVGDSFGRSVSMFQDYFLAGTYTWGYTNPIYVFQRYINGINDWIAFPTYKGIIQTNVVFSGGQGIEIQASSSTTTVHHLFGAVGKIKVWENYYIQSSRWPTNEVPEVSDTATALYYVNSLGQLVVYDGVLASNNWVTLTNHAAISTSTWVRFTVRQDFSSQQWALLLNGLNVAENLGFANSATEYSIASFIGATNASTYLDNITISTTQPVLRYSVFGTINYDGSQTGQIWTVAVKNSGSWATNCNCKISEPGSYSITNLFGPDNYWFKAYRDSDGNGSNDIYEAWGSYTNNPVCLVEDETGVDILLNDPDTDEDGLPDWWEIECFGNLDQVADGDYDGDGLSNLGEYQNSTDPTDSDTDNDGVNDGDEIDIGYGPAVSNFYALYADFEQTNGYSVGALDGQQGWQTSSANGVQVQKAMVRRGDHAVRLEGLEESMSKSVTSRNTTVISKMYVYLGDQLIPPTNLPASVSCMVSFNSTNGIVAFNGDGSGGGNWVTATNTILTKQWVQLGVEQNYSHKTWKLSVNGVEKLTNLGFKDNSTTNLNSVNVRSGIGGSVYSDDIGIIGQ